MHSLSDPLEVAGLRLHRGELQLDDEPEGFDDVKIRRGRWMNEVLDPKSFLASFATFDRCAETHAPSQTPYEVQRSAPPLTSVTFP